MAAETAINVHEKDNRNVITRGDAVAWGSTFDTSLRHLGRRIVEELEEFNPRPSDARTRAIGIELATEEPPLSTEMSWALYDGIRETMEDRRAEEAFLAQQEGVTT